MSEHPRAAPWLMVVGPHYRALPHLKDMDIDIRSVVFAHTPERMMGVNVDAVLFVGEVDVDTLRQAVARINAPRIADELGGEGRPVNELLSWLWDDELEHATKSNERLWMNLAAERMGLNPSWKEQLSATRRKALEKALRIVDEGAFDGNINVTRLRAAINLGLIPQEPPPDQKR